MQTEVLQGDTLPFHNRSYYILRGPLTPKLGLILKHRQSSSYPVMFLTDLDYADDIALLSDIIRSAQSLLSTLEHAAVEVGLSINQLKTNLLVINPSTTPIAYVGPSRFRR